MLKIGVPVRFYLLSFCFLLSIFPAVQGALIFYDDFENGQFDEWDDTYIDYKTDTLIVSLDTGTVHNGKYSYKADDATASYSSVAIRKYFNLTSEFYCRFYVYFPTGFFGAMTDAQKQVIAEFKGANNSYMWIKALRYSSGDYRITNSKISSYFGGVQENTWYCFEIKVPPCSTNQTVRWWINGTEQGSGAASFSTYIYWKSFLLGLYYTSNSTLQKAYFDDMIISDSYIGVTTTAPYAGNFRFDRNLYSVNEGAGSIKIKVKRKGGSAGTVSVTCSVSSGVATSGTDYTLGTAVLNWADGDSADKDLTVNITDDST